MRASVFVRPSHRLRPLGLSPGRVSRQCSSPRNTTRRGTTQQQPQKKMLVVLRTARPLVVPRGTQRRLLSVSVGAVAGGCVMTRASRARMLEAAPPPPPATAILAQRRRAGADLDDDANVLQHLARACFRLARIVETSIRLGALATPLVLAVRGPASAKSAKFRRLAAMASPAMPRNEQNTARRPPSAASTRTAGGATASGRRARRGRRPSSSRSGPRRARTASRARSATASPICKTGRRRTRGATRSAPSRRRSGPTGATCSTSTRRPSARAASPRCTRRHEAASCFLGSRRRRGASGVHTQVLKKDVTNGGRRGDRVAVKVVHPAARRRVASDLDFLRACARAGEALIPRAKWFNLAAAADEFAATLGAQMDMRAARGRRPETRLLASRGEPHVDDVERNPRAPRHSINQRRRPTTSSACGRTSGTRAA